MTAAITGAAIGFLVWAGAALISYFNSDARIDVTGTAFECFISTGSGAAIGWLIGGGA